MQLLNAGTQEDSTVEPVQVNRQVHQVINPTKAVTQNLLEESLLKIKNMVVRLTGTHMFLIMLWFF